MKYHYTHPEAVALQNGVRRWWDVTEKRIVDAFTAYLPQGCPDWGEKMAPPHNLCTFCALPTAARLYREEFFAGRHLTPEESLGILRANMDHFVPARGSVHTLQVFNGGSFLAAAANPPELQEEIARIVAAHPTLRRLVVESRAELITLPALRRLTAILRPASKGLTVRIGVETKNDFLRVKTLRKGHSRRQLADAVAAMKAEGVVSGGYVLLNPAPGLEPAWALQETHETIEWVLGSESGGLAMDEAYFGPTCVAPGTPLEKEWLAGRFQPATLWATWQVLSRAVERHGLRVHLLPFKDEPPFVAVPSNHAPNGLPESLEGALGCDREFHHLFQQYRDTMDVRWLRNPPRCSCRPDPAG